MGCSGSSLNKRDRTTKKLRKPKPWEFPRPVTWSQLVQMRDEFWDSAPHHGGKKEIWDAIHAAAEEADIELAQTILDSAGVIVHKPDMTVCYDETGTKYKIPRYVLSEPTNLIQLS
ncbi:putative Ubiquitin domain-containing protein 1/2 [Helianthus annuus]|uniref:Putative ubiquitin-binding domain-containing protein n=1 Tax=Helianthus annuus TaxID=4232 RepID=A0A251UXU5_HELAN|nr:ubiquitin domain-containing protein 1 [Helianthus annuus]KAF5780799.1 putative Ubiquitin domain-containing protein 1/2 [Helianthus annuus]KAJ0873990.1 putative Ubiquitin domain-containing protein [Helianthus annuus]